MYTRRSRNKLKYREYIFCNMKINSYANRAQSHGSTVYFVKYKTSLKRILIASAFHTYWDIYW